MIKFKACPSCGQDNEIKVFVKPNGFQVTCTHDWMSTDIMPTEEQAIQHWNSRPIEDALTAEVTKQKKLLSQLAWACWKADNDEELTDEISGDLYSELLKYFPGDVAFEPHEGSHE